MCLEIRLEILLEPRTLSQGHEEELVFIWWAVKGL